MNSIPATTRKDIESELQDIGRLPDEEIDLAHTALLLAALERPGAELSTYERHLSEMTREAGARLIAENAGDSLENIVGAINRVLYQQFGYKGDDESYDDLNNANLMSVMDRRRGLPVALGIIYLHVARRLDCDAVGLSFPGHFLIRVGFGGERGILDPFNEGRSCTPADMRQLLKAMAGVEAELTRDHYSASGNLEILLRLQNNLKLRLLKAQRADEALPVVEGMLLLAPRRAELWREAGLIHNHLGQLHQGIHALEQYLDLAGPDRSRQDTARLLEEMRGRLN